LLSHPVDQSLIRQLSIVTSNKTETDMNSPEKNVSKPSGTVVQASEADVTGAFTGPASQNVPGPAQGRAAQPMDRWFDDQLNRLFNDVSSEPLPPDLADLVGKLRAQGKKTDVK
jgi:hypothetical protein